MPVFRQNFPDPFIIEHDGHYLAYATNTARGETNVQMASSPDLISWQSVRDPAEPARLLDAMPILPTWAKRGFTWAPEVLRAGNRYLLYFTARHAKSGLQCTGVASSSDPRGPFTSGSPEPLVCQSELGGTIDASPFRDADGQLFLYFKNDGNHPDFRKPTEIFAQRLAPDGMRLFGERVSLLRNDRPWENHVVESPTMVRFGDRYVMFFSANDFGWQAHEPLSRYAMGYANCSGPMGPCTDAPENPILYSYSAGKGNCLSGPGHQAVFQAKGRTYITFHSWNTTEVCGRTELSRFMYVAPLFWQNNKPQIGPSLRPRGASGVSASETR